MKDKYIVEMAEDLHEELETENVPYHECDFMAQRLVKKGWIKPDKDSVVLSKEEYEKLKSDVKYWDNKHKTDSEEYQQEIYDRGLEIIKLRRENKETVEEILNWLDTYYPYYSKAELIKELAKQYGVELTTDDTCKHYDKVNMRCNAAKCTPTCYCDGHKSKCTEYPNTKVRDKE